jgi:hypothetical protein
MKCNIGKRLTPYKMRKILKEIVANEEKNKPSEEELDDAIEKIDDAIEEIDDAIEK